jgi:signal peptidase I
VVSAVGYDVRPSRRAARASAQRRSWTIAVWVIASAILVVVCFGLLFQLAGGRWFIVQTPSMGQAAPIGTLVFDSPATYSSLRVGQIISFHPPTSPDETYTHRIVSITSAGISTRGDINGATDPWTLHRADIIGRVTTILPGIGWLARALPYLLIGAVLVWVATTPLRSPTTRSAWRISGLSLVAAFTAFMLHPFVGVLVLQTSASRRSASATLVSSGLLPIRVTAAGGTSAHLVSGQVGTVSIPSLARNGHYALSSALDLSIWGWIIFILLCMVPLLWVLVIGLPRDPYRELRR